MIEKCFYCVIVPKIRDYTESDIIFVEFRYIFAICKHVSKSSTLRKSVEFDFSFINVRVILGRYEFKLSYINNVGFEVLMAVVMKSSIFWI
jgi:hypothetical protein